MPSTLGLSVVIPAYNAESWIDATLRAALAQTYPPNEIIVVNDASTDDTAAKCRRLMRRRTTVPIIYHEESIRGGGGAARNIGAEIASYDWIFNLDADDIIPRTLLEMLVAKALVEGPEAIIHTEFAQYFEDEPSTRFGITMTKRRLLHRWRFASDSHMTFLTSPQSPASAGNRLLSRSTFDAVGGYFVDTGSYDAWAFGIKCYANGRRFVSVPGSTYLHRLNTQSYWMSNERDGSNRCYLYNALSHFPEFYSESLRRLVQPDNPEYPREPFLALQQAWPTS